MEDLELLLKAPIRKQVQSSVLQGMEPIWWSPVTSLPVLQPESRRLFRCSEPKEHTIPSFPLLSIFRLLPLTWEGCLIVLRQHMTLLSRSAYIFFLFKKFRTLKKNTRHPYYTNIISIPCSPFSKSPCTLAPSQIYVSFSLLLSHINTDTHTVCKALITLLLNWKPGFPIQHN